MDYFPLFTKLTDTPCLIVGGGTVAARKAAALARAGAVITVIAPDITKNLASLIEDKTLTHVERKYQQGDVSSDYRLVIAATDDTQVNQQVAEQAHALAISVNVIDAPELCSVILPSIIDRDPVIVAVSSGARSPVLARVLRARLETLIPARYGRLAELIGKLRNKVREQITVPQARRGFWERALQGPISELVFSGRDADAEQLVEKVLADTENTESGEVYLVGAGPGDPDLLSFRALRLMQQADVVLYDRLVAPEILDLVRREAERVYVGKRRAYHAVRQEEINETLARLALEGKRVLRLKGGDPFIFGRGGEEVETLAEQGVPFQIVPGVTAASGCACYAGIPLTHRDYAQSVIFVTGHLKDGELQLNWKQLAQPQQTVVVYMSLTNIDVLCDQLVAHGMSADTPVALVSRGTTVNQDVITATLASLSDEIEGKEIHAPTLTIIGDVVKLHDKLNWFGN
ncbi:MAG: uroporphyrinogen-III C-methyltransferase [Gammaproteobacteria bacterium]|nr:uroporphyrinogen-III C-methyltransferase [Gammaproteobacteria bacterium]